MTELTKNAAAAIPAPAAMVVAIPERGFCCWSSLSTFGTEVESHRSEETRALCYDGIAESGLDVEFARRSLLLH